MFQKISFIVCIQIMGITCISTQSPTLQTPPHALITPYRAVTIDPIVEMDSIFPPPINPPASPDTEKCYRAHQGLYNETVTVLEECDEYIRIVYDSVRYTVEDENSFWTFKKGFLPLSKIHSTDVINTIPHPSYGEEPTIVLIYPWQNFSVGTRFKHLIEHDTNNEYVVTLADYTQNIAQQGNIPRTHAIQETKQTKNLQRALFMHNIHHFLNRVAQEGPGMVIPYVWGGSSFLKPSKSDNFYRENGLWHRTDVGTFYTGYDCSGLIMRMAKIAGIDFPWKTSTAMQRAKKNLTGSDILEEGDIIGVAGHVMLVGNLKNNEVIESCGYGRGYGAVHRIQLHKLFDGIKSFKQLRAHYHNKKPIRFKNKNGTLGKPQTVQLFKLID